MLLHLRRGMYAFPTRSSPGRVHAPYLAGQLYAPSYVSTHWTLAYYGMIPEFVARYTSVTSHATRTFENAFGGFSYQHVKRPAFFGYRRIVIDGQPVFIAEPEKALLDLWHLQAGPWTRDGMEAMRFQGFEHVDAAKLNLYAARFASPRLMRAATVFLNVAQTETEGTVQL